jgi:hypothetical protein
LFFFSGGFGFVDVSSHPQVKSVLEVSGHQFEPHHSDLSQPALRTKFHEFGGGGRFARDNVKSRRVYAETELRFDEDWRRDVEAYVAILQGWTTNGMSLILRLNFNFVFFLL